MLYELRGVLLEHPHSGGKRFRRGQFIECANGKPISAPVFIRRQNAEEKVG